MGFVGFCALGPCLWFIRLPFAFIGTLFTTVVEIPAGPDRSLRNATVACFVGIALLVLFVLVATLAIG